MHFTRNRDFCSTVLLSKRSQYFFHLFLLCAGGGNKGRSWKWKEMLRFPHISQCVDLGLNLGMCTSVFHKRTRHSLWFYIMFYFLRQNETTVVYVWSSLLARNSFSSSVGVGLICRTTYPYRRLWYDENYEMPKLTNTLIESKWFK